MYKIRLYHGTFVDAEGHNAQSTKIVQNVEYALNKSSITFTWTKSPDYSFSFTFLIKLSFLNLSFPRF